MNTVHIETTVHGRVLVQTPDERAVGVLLAFHGYGQLADDILEDVRRIPGAERWTIMAPQGLNRFYTRGDERVVANWMTRQDRELAIADNVAYIDAVLDSVLEERGTLNAGPRTEDQGPRTDSIVCVGFSQGAAMAYRAALLGRHPVAGVVALAGDIPPELKEDASLRWPRVLIGVGDTEPWYAGDKLKTDLQFLEFRGVDHQIVRFTGGHEWTDEFRAKAGEWLDR